VGVYGTAGPYVITLKLDNLPGAATTLDLKVFGIEMVFVPKGQFTLGEQGPCINYEYFNKVDITAADVVAPTSLTISPASGGAFTYTVPATYPKGYNAFYCMKYEITQGQYADFLNTLTAAAQTARYNPNMLPNVNTYRFAITNTGTAPNIYATPYPDRACNFMSFMDVLAYLDWSCMRPMSEMEFEKACRGQGPFFPNCYVWGNSTPPTPSVVNTSLQVSFTTPGENGTETIISPVNANINMQGSSGLVGGAGPGTQGPIRVGIFALPTTSTRYAANATYYGILDMAGNVAESVIPVTMGANAGYTCTSSFTATSTTLGNGYLSAAGDHDVTGVWPVAPGTASTANSNVASSLAFGYRGGAWDNNGQACGLGLYYDPLIAHRYFCFANYRYSWAGSVYRALGGRGVRGF